MIYGVDCIEINFNKNVQEGNNYENSSQISKKKFHNK